MKRLVLMLVVAVAVSATAARADDQNVAGTWTMSVNAEIDLKLVLTQKGKRVTGTLQNPHGNAIAVSGEFERGRFRFFGSSTGGEWDYNLAGIGEMKTDGSMTGTLTSNVGEMKWTAARAATEITKSK